ncbi:MAG: hypothetical protein KJ593_00730 [Candidatus Omnitrophica bacterium]|nr:hypothetical protein [Candidatus Omnitrophota bacterium]
MAEDINRKGFNTALKVILGMALVIIGVISIVIFWPSVVEIIKACLGFVLLLAGAIMLAIAKD